MHFFEFKNEITGLKHAINLDNVISCFYDSDNNDTHVKMTDGIFVIIPGDALKSFRAILREKYTVHFGE